MRLRFGREYAGGVIVFNKKSCDSHASIVYHCCHGASVNRNCRTGLRHLCPSSVHSGDPDGRTFLRQIGLMHSPNRCKVIPAAIGAFLTHAVTAKRPLYSQPSSTCWMTRTGVLWTPANFRLCNQATFQKLA